MDTLKEFLNILKWPLVVFGVVLLFRKSIQSLIKNIKTLKTPGGLEAEIKEQVLANQKREDKPTTVSIVKQPGEFEKAKGAIQLTPVMQEYANRIREDTRKSTLPIHEQTELGIMAIANLAVSVDYWRIYNFIFGSQFKVLHTANSALIKKADAITHFTTVQKMYPDVFKESDFETYISFLTTHVLIGIKDDTYFITVKGKDFLGWCIDNNLSFSKQY